VIEVVALAHGIDGVLLTTSVGIIAGLGGFVGGHASAVTACESSAKIVAATLAAKNERDDAEKKA